MKMKMLVAVLFLCPALFAAPRISNGTLQTVPTLAAAESIGTGWIGYAVASARPISISCCDDNISIHRYDRDDLRPVGDQMLNVFARYENGAVSKIRVYSSECSLDAGGQSVRWVEQVTPAESIAFLRRVAESGAKHARGGALLVLSLHAGAIDALIDIARHDNDESVRGQALFWLSQSAGEKAAAALRDAVENDPEASVRAKAVFAISQLPDDQSVPMLIDLLKHNSSRDVRKKAAFWLGQKKDPRALQAFEEILRQ